MKSIGTLHYNTVGTTFQVIKVIESHTFLTKVQIWNPRMRELQTRLVYGGHGMVLTLYKESEDAQ